MSGLLLSPFQASLFRSRADEIFWGSSRGASKTFGAVGLLLAEAQQLPGYEGVIFRKLFKEFSSTIFPVVEKWFKILDDAQFKLVRSLEPRIEHLGQKSKIHISAAETETDAGKFQGGSFHRILVDEAQQVAPKVLEMIPAIARAAVGDHKPQIIYLANPNGPGHSWLKRRFISHARRISPHGNVDYGAILDKDGCPLYPGGKWVHPVSGQEFDIQGHWNFDLEEEIEVEGEKRLKKKNIDVFLSKTWMNPQLDYYDYIATLQRSLADNVTKAAQWIDNDWDAISGEFFPRLADAIRPVEVDTYDRILLGIDPGQRKTACVWAAVGRDGIYKIFDEKMYFAQDIPEKVPKIESRHPDYTLGILDPNSGRQTLESSGSRTIRKCYMDAGLKKITLCKTRDRRSGWEALRTAMSDGTLLIDPSCAGLIDSLSSLTAKENDTDDCDKYDGNEFQDDGDHYADALRYMFVNGFYTGNPEESEFEKMQKKDPEFAYAVYGGRTSRRPHRRIRVLGRQNR